jgi:hypothetical protein
VIAEILARCGTGRGRFVEFGAEFGVETNCSVLCDVRGFGGLYIEGAPASYARLERRYAARDDVTTLRSLVTPENIESLLRTAGVPSEFDVLSMDVDGAEYWIWEALESYAPRVVVAEYNAALDPGRRLVQPRDAGPWDRTDFVGASIGALRSLAEAKGYRHVHCELGGNNAFFVRADLPGRWPERVLLRGPNFFLLGGAHLPDRSGREYVELDA